MRYHYQNITGKKNYLKNLLYTCIVFILIPTFSLRLSAQNYIVNSNADAVAVNLVTGETATPGQITLRSAIQAATAQPGAHIITFSGAVVSPINLTLGQITVGNSAAGNNITITGPGMNLLTVNQTTDNRVFSTGTGAVTFVLQDITLNCTAPGAVPYSGGGGAIIAGGASAATTLTNVTISNFRSQIGNGGAISQSSSLNDHDLTITNCTFTNNKCGGAGGAVSFNSQGGTATITGCTFSGNQTGPVGANTGGDGGALSTTGGGSGGTYLVEKNTFLNNQVLNNTGHAGAVMNTNGTLTLRYNRFIGNTCANVAFPPLANIVGQAGGATTHVTIADNNWWGVNTGPGANDATALAAGAVMTLTKWLQLKHTASPASINIAPPGGTTTLTASFLSNSASEAIAVGNLSTLIGLPITFNNAIKGVISSPQPTIQASGTATATYTLSDNQCPPPGSADAKVDNATATASIIIVDNVPPQITACAPDVTVSCAADTTVNYSLVTATDNCPPVTLRHTNSISNKTCDNRFTITRTYIATDQAGNTATCTQIVTVNDVTPPSLTCPAPVTVSCASAVPAPDINAVTGVNDNCSGTVTVTHEGDIISNQTCDNRYTITRTYKATDACGNTATCTQVITVNDQTPPAITCPAPITVSCAGDVPAADITAVTGVSDNCGGNVTITHVGDVVSNQTCQNRYTITRTYKATDVCGNTATCSQIITVNDQTPPTITCPANVTVYTGPGNTTCTQTASWSDPIVNDNCSNISSVTSSPASGSLFHIGNNIVRYTVTDACGNTATCSFTVTVVDNTPPEVTCPANIIATESPAGSGTALVGLPALSATDNCGISDVFYVIGGIKALTSYTFPIGTTMVERIARDNNGNTASCSFTVTVNPACVITCPADITVNTLSTDLQCGTIVNYPAATTTGNCGTLNYSTPSGSFFPVGSTTVVVSSPTTGQSCSFKVTVVDKTPPVISCPANITMSNASNQCGANVSFAATASDNCTGVSINYSHASGSFFPVGATTVTATASDVAGNTSSCTFTVTVVDAQNPTITCPANIIVNNAVNQCGANVTFAAIASDNCPGVSVSYSPASGSFFPVGTTTVTATATDAAGNTSSCTFTVTVVDAQNPTITCPANIIVNNAVNQCGANVTFAAIASDNCPGVSVSYSPASGSFFPVGTTTVTATATDASGRTASCTFNVRVVDTQTPTISCPANITVNNTPGQCSASVTYTAPVGTDNCPGSITTQTAGGASGSIFPVGTTTNTFKVTDAAGNTASCSFTVTVVDNEKPSITCPSNKSVNAATGLCYATAATVNTGTATATDNCPGVTVAGIRSDALALSANYPVGTTTITWTATDAHSNTRTCTQTITVIDNQPPVISGVSASPSSLWPPNHTMRDVTVNYSSTDNCGLAGNCTLTVASNEPINGTGDGDTSPDWIVVDNHHVKLRAERAGNGNGRIYTITITCTDAAGNSSTASTTVIVAHNITAPLSGNAFKIGSTVNFAGTFWDKPGNTHTAQWLIDGMSVTGTLTEPSGLKNGTVGGSYKFGSAGVYKLQMNLKDQTGAVSYANTQGDMEAIVVIYDPNGGYTYGGGYFNSPAGSLKSNPSATGKVSYGFNSNYFKGATNPKGETQMQFQIGNLEFNALNFDYLAISGAKAQYKGSGKITGDQAGYSFIMTVIDGAINGTGTDKIRLKIFNKNSGAVIYDNQPGASDADDPTTVVGSGSTVVIVNPAAAGINTITAGDANGHNNRDDFTAHLFDATVMPNPTTENFRLQVITTGKELIQVRVVDILGRQVKQMKLAPYQTVFFGSDMRKGIYIVEITQGESHKIIKLQKL